ncbi:hypothetical protein IV203_024101 [Nitzschia inconspicua]|uniref:EF-hand domain-containing protein n=1 Tax=Nitzschia inconspicua TaxID=303405 RepID=A0A9K3PAS2_9STRA|nr:hypothetical protein IV203_024101 [Nitzschia inconspicua]
MPPKHKRRGTRRNTCSNEMAPPEDLIHDSRRQEILQVFQEALQRSRSGAEEYVDTELPLSDARKALKKLQLEGIKTEEIQRYFGSDEDDDNKIDSIDADMFLRFSAAMTLQKEKSDKAFQLMDGGEKGLVLIEDLQRVAADLGEDLSEEDLHEMMDFVDPSGEGLLSPKHFFKIARQVNL